jgi:hypothetical protein
MLAIKLSAVFNTNIDEYAVRNDFHLKRIDFKFFDVMLVYGNIPKNCEIKITEKFKVFKESFSKKVLTPNSHLV